LSWGPVTFRYAGGVLGDATKHALIILAGIEAIFLAELIVSHLLPHLLQNQGDFWQLMQLVLLAAPEGLFISLPLALLISIYLVLLRRKEAREFVAGAGMGRSPRTLVVLCVVFGLAGFAVSMVLTGFVEPHARYQMGRAFFDLRYEALRNGEIGPGKFYESGDLAVFAAGGRVNEVADDLFVLQRLENNRSRVIVADRTLSLGAAAGSTLGLVLDRAAVYELSLLPQGALMEGVPEGFRVDCRDCRSLRPASLDNLLTLSRVVVELPQFDFPELRPRGERSEERTLFELLQGDLADASNARVLGERLLRGLLCIVAPLLALLAMTVTTGRTMLLVLPAAAGLVLAGSFFGAHAVRFLSAGGLAGVAFASLGATLLISLVAVLLARRFEAGAIRASGVRV